MKGRRLSMVLLTRTAPPNVAGLPSLLFHLSDRGGAELAVVGPNGVADYVSTVQESPRPMARGRPQHAK
jgi:ribonuclease BN (tRNA processing enzyme)